MTASGQLRDSQMVMANFLRDPTGNPPPEGVEARRLQIYQDLIYNNIEGFISSGFPVLRSLYGSEDWHALVRLFIDGHRCHTPYFLEISQEFLGFLVERHERRDCDPPFMAELAHYEWVELALDVAEEEPPAPTERSDIAAARPSLSPVAWVLAYQFPVHMIGPEHRPEVPGEPTFLAVYRDRSDRVRFLELNQASARLLELVRDGQDENCQQVLVRLADEMGADPATLRDFGLSQLAEFHGLGLIGFDY